MPHANLPPPGFQALILCGPGASFTTFTSTPHEIPKALLPIANRPMVWYPLEYCYRMGITDITVITPPESLEAIEAAMSQNPHLTSLPAPKPDILAPKDLHHASGTTELFRLPEVQAAIKGDFVVLPCDLVCEQDGAPLIDAWMVEQAGLGAASGGVNELGPVPLGIAGEKSRRRGGLGVWYQTKGEASAKGEETDFIATTPLPPGPVPAPADSLRRNISNLVYTVPTDTLKDITEENKCLPIRHTLIRKHARVRMLTTYRDSHLYFFPYWVIEMMRKNETFESVSEDVLGWWAKAGWQDGLGDKLGLRDIFYPDEASDGEGEGRLESSQFIEEEIDVSKLSSTWSSTLESSPSTALASRVQNSNIPEAAKSISTGSKLPVPPILAYVQPSDPSLPLIRRVDTAHLLLTVSLRLAKLPSIEEAGKDASPFAHQAKIAHKAAIPLRCRVEAENSLLAENVIVQEKSNIKESVIGTGCTIGEGARLLRCLLMDGVEVGPNVQLTDCILGRRCKIEGGPTKSDEKTVLTKCEVQDGQVVEWGTEAKGEKIMRFDMGSDMGDDVGMDMGDNGGFDGAEDEGIPL
ncbi:eukaryotic translation initiation factor-like protein subunit eIF2B-gamma [Aaosphaeria arxii CBS 175.79]|uniref:Mannose-1-phosphate guanyltransferase n=1 Tax=Aaosphaeria arxii CBS 175.79 TaxID=1450172 RepID=A0A6A5XE56_9PLEO|nr:eukaryotic translation initiation factor-like protein subunit eIF2B-gamma [Aaosphaeria arxii CBS 175.79]KAF2011106.1 eukaryotic translation initiation factor-like protein subunit eIF2B-gamma [Aaosphaeria arxii CBS 175.79]